MRPPRISERGACRGNEWQTAQRPITVCGPGAHVVLKALAFYHRGENKDAYDLYYVVRGREDTAHHFRRLIENEYAQQAMNVLEKDFSEPEMVGPRRVAECIGGSPDDDLQADVSGLIRALLGDLKAR